MVKDFVKSFFQKKSKGTGIGVIREILEFLDTNDLYPDTRVISSAVLPSCIIDGKQSLMFASNDYLGLANHPKVKEAAIEAIKNYGVGSTGSRLVSGNINIHLELESKLAKFKGGEDAIIFPTGFAANLGTINGLMNPLKVTAAAYLNKKGIILSDELNHASIVDGVRLSGQKKVIYRHCDLKHLETLLKKYVNRRKIIVTDSVFSMDGDIAPLDKISQLAKKYGAMTMIDEAHAVGVLGKNGGGAMEHFNLKTSEDITVVMGTMSKSLGSSGGYVVGSKDLVKYLRIAARSYMFSTTLLPAASAAACTAIDLINTDHSFIERLWSNINYLKNGFNEAGLTVMKSDSAIIPVLIGTDEAAVRVARALFEKNIFAPCVRWPVVPRGESRIRFTVTAAHSKDQLDTLVKVSSEVIKNFVK